MASFKLGRIKGEKGDTGASGAKGERGNTGERGDSGATPVFEIGGVETVASDASASVEIDASNPEIPKLYFRIPKGKDGKDAMGDMLSGIYDTEGRKTDVYKFAQTLFEGVLSKSGGTVSGKLLVQKSPTGESCVRNIIFATSLPEKASEGDICFITAEEYENTIYSNGVGSVLLLSEGGEKCEYIVAAKDYHGKNSVTLIRKHLPEFQEYYNFSARETYYCSNIDYFLETVYSRLYPEYIQKKMLAAEPQSFYKRHCFLPSCTELMEMEYFKNNPIETTTDIGILREYMTRDIDARGCVSTVNILGKIISVEQYQKSSIRPMIVLDGSLIVRNSIHNGNAVTEPAEEVKGYYYSENKWKELID